MEELSVKFEMVKIAHHSSSQSSTSEQQSRKGGKFILKWYEKQKIWSSCNKKDVLRFCRIIDSNSQTSRDSLGIVLDFKSLSIKKKKVLTCIYAHLRLRDGCKDGWLNNSHWQ